MGTFLNIFNKKNILWLLFFGSLIGLNETLIASFSFPYRSVVINTLSITILAIARYKIPFKGTTILIILIAVLYKISNHGIYSCNTGFFLCGPTAMLMSGISFEILASLLINKQGTIFFLRGLTCFLSAITAFGLFAIMNTFILNSWNIERLYQYIFTKGSLAGVLSASLTIFFIFISNVIKLRSFSEAKNIFVNSMLMLVILSVWVFGSLVRF